MFVNLLFRLLWPFSLSFVIQSDSEGSDLNNPAYWSKAAAGDAHSIGNPAKGLLSNIPVLFSGILVLHASE